MASEETMDDILKNLLASIPEIVAAAVVTPEGLPIAAQLPAGVDETRIAAMTAAILSLGDRAAAELGKGMLEQVFVRGENGYILVMSAGEEAVLTLSTTKDVKLGLIFLDAKRTCDKIVKLI
jgi:predicted regulator of Ras-like GTPase activity (Roadblock/LC7/MglB family)